MPIVGLFGVSDATIGARVVAAVTMGGAGGLLVGACWLVLQREKWPLGIRLFLLLLIATLGYGAAFLYLILYLRAPHVAP
jgi:hypothetical protein